MSNSAPDGEQRITLIHGDVFGHPERDVNPDWVETCSDFQVIPSAMEKVTTQLKNLRKAATPRLTVRALAEALDMPLGSYARYESIHDYKKRYLPIDFTRKVAGVLARYGVDPAEVMKLAGLSAGEAEPEAREIEASRPAFQLVTLSVALPNEDALADMFQTMLVAVPAEASRAEAARILARLLPSGFAGIGPAALVQGRDAPPAAEATPPHPATDDRESAQP
ncbi:helix-turn-helix transcriptional regulator [Sphingobium sp. AN558]|uniref:helix-turn-helix transcriptional regulator n=1 Tax=Sphingobium sp. AN558 TaxID=3133442 RepID=UPI0030BFF5EC